MNKKVILSAFLLVIIVTIGYLKYTNKKTGQKQTDLIAYGRDLIEHTAKYYGPKGIIQNSTNGMNCQNCHLEAGTKLWGLNYKTVYATYPKYRARSGGIESIYKRVNDCFERSLNGKAIDSNSKEMQAIYAYIKSVGNTMQLQKNPNSTSLEPLPYLKIAANPKKGNTLFIKHCQTCHGLNGQGVLDSTTGMFVYPPLWGAHSYNNAAGLFQISKLAGFIKNNMPNAVSFKQPLLTNQEAWDLAAYINSQPRPVKDISKDFPDKSQKPIDYPYGPYSDSFSEQAHKYGPYEPIQQQHKNRK